MVFIDWRNHKVLVSGGPFMPHVATPKSVDLRYYRS
jgi:hypothetical protein